MRTRPSNNEGIDLALAAISDTLAALKGLPDPAAGTGVGEFKNEELQNLYDSLIAQGTVSLVRALEVGVFIEETDIADLLTGIESTTQNDIMSVFSNLLQGSENHLDAFCSNLAGFKINCQ